MNVTESNMITSTVEYLRRNVYNVDRFKHTFDTELSHKIHAIEVTFVPEQFGGWSVDVTLNRNECITDGIENHNSESYVELVTNSLLNAAFAVDRSVFMFSDLGPNLVNIIITGPNSIAVKI